MHLIIDGFNGDRAKLADLEFIYRLLEEYPGRIGMRKIMPPYVFRYSDSKPDDWGVSGFVLIAESHISIHTFPERAYANIDIFSCKAFDAEMATQHLREALGLGEVKTHLLARGLEYPFDVQLATGIVERERSGLASPKR